MSLIKTFAIVLAFASLAAGCGDLLTSRPIEKLLEPTKGTFYVVQQDDTVKRLADREIIFLDNSGFDGYKTNYENRIESLTQKLESEIKNLEGQINSLTNKISNQKIIAQDQYNDNESSLIDNVEKEKANHKSLLSEFEAFKNSTDLKISQINEQLSRFNSRSKRYNQLDADYSDFEKSFLTKTKDLSEKLIIKINQEIKLKGLPISLMDSSLASSSRISISNNSWLYDNGRIGSINAYGGGLFANDDVNKRSQSSLVFKTKEKYGSLTYYKAVNIPTGLPEDVKDRIKKDFDIWWTEVAAYWHERKRVKKALKEELKNLYPWVNAIPSEIVSMARLKITNQNPLKIEETLREFRRSFAIRIIHHEESANLAKNAYDMALDALQSLRNDKDGWIASKEKDLGSKILSEINDKISKIDSLNAEKNNKLSSFKLSLNETLNSLYVGAMGTTRTDLDGNFEVPINTKYVFATIDRLNDEKLYWLVKLPDSIQKFEMKNSNTISANSLREKVHFIAVDNK